jgi:ATP phosphoribosyltransferase
MTLRLALPDDALREQALELLAAAGVAIDAAPTSGGATADPSAGAGDAAHAGAAGKTAPEPAAARLVVVAAADVPAYLACGAAELGVMAKTALLEGGAGLCELLDLRFGASLLVYATGPAAAARGQRLGRLRIATRHPHLARSFFVSRGVQIAVVEVAGELDRAVRDGLADGMVTLAEAAPGAGPPVQVAGLDVAGVVAEGGARLVAGRGGRVLHAAAIGALVGRLRGALAERIPA